MTGNEKSYSVAIRVPLPLRSACRERASQRKMPMCDLLGESVVEHYARYLGESDAIAVRSEIAWAKKTIGGWPCVRMSVRLYGTAAMTVRVLAEQLAVSRATILLTRAMNEYWPDEKEIRL